MKNAKELGAITQASINAEIAKMTERAITTLETKICPQMEQAAKEGSWDISFHVDTHIAITPIIERLSENGYKVNRSGRQLRISWL